MPWVGLSPNTKKLFFRLSPWDDELSSVLKITAFLVNSSPKLHEPSNAKTSKLQMLFLDDYK